MMTTEMITEHAHDTAKQYGISVPDNFSAETILKQLGELTFELDGDWDFLHAYGDAMSEMVDTALGITPDMYPL